MAAWPDCPPDVRAQVRALVRVFQEALGDGLEAAYLHGSLALGGFNPQRSDIDALVITRHRLTPPQRRQLFAWLLAHSGAPSPIELSSLTQDQLWPWRHPTPFDLHFSETWRPQLTADLGRPDWPGPDLPAAVDDDLAAHVTMARARGVALVGPPPAQGLPPVPAADFRASLLSDFHWALERLDQLAIYFILNTCRLRAYLDDGRLLSKDEGARWALSHVPAEARPAVEQASAVYRSQPQARLRPEAVTAFVAWARLAIPPV